VIDKLTKENDKFLFRTVQHRNFEWAVKHMCIESDQYSGVAQHIYKNIPRAISTIPEYSNVMSEQVKQFLTKYTNKQE